MPTERKFPEPQAYETGPCPHIPTVEVESNQVRAIGYDEATRTLRVIFRRGKGDIYDYPNVEPKFHELFMNAESKGTFHGQNVRPLPFKKYPAASEVAA